MNLLKTEKIETNKYKLEISIGAEEFEAALQKAYLRNVKRMNVPGFRKGKAPRKMIEKLYGEEIFYEDAVNSLYPNAYSEAIDESKLEPVDKAEVDISKVTREGFTFTAIVTVRPEVSVKDYKGIQAVKYIASVTDKEVDAELNRVRDRAGRLVVVEDRPAQLGDAALIDFEGFSNGEAFEGGKGEAYPLQLGSGQFIPGFEEQVVGKKIGEEFDVEVTFPEEYGEASLAGKPALFKCKLHELKAKELPDLDDEFAKDVSEFSTLEEYKADITAKIKERKDKIAQDNVENSLIDSVIANMEAEIPTCMYEQRMDQSVKEFEYRLSTQGMSLEGYLQYTGMELESFRKTFAEQSEKQVKIRLALEKIVELENIVPSDEEVDKEFETLAESYNLKLEDVKRAIAAKDVMVDLAVNKAIDFVRDNAVIEEKEAPAAEEKAAE